MTRNRTFRIGKRHPSVRTNLSESKLAIILMAVFSLLCLGLFYLLFHFDYPSNMFRAMGLSQEKQADSGGSGHSDDLSQFKLASTAFEADGAIPLKYACPDGQSLASPPLSWSNVPADTASFVLIVHDLELRPNRSPEDTVQWMIWNIPGSVTRLTEQTPSATAYLRAGDRHNESTNEGSSAYRKICIPFGIEHHLVYELFALDTMLSLEQNPTRGDLLKAIDGHILGRAVLVGLLSE